MFPKFFSFMEEVGEGEGGGGGEDKNPQIAEWASSIEDENIRGIAGKYESQDAFLKATGYEPPKTDEPKDWRDGLDEDLKKTADRFTSPADAIRAINDLRKRDSQVRLPGKEATPEEIAAYHKAIGVPEKGEDYDWPEVSEEELTDQLKESRKIWGERFRDMGVPKETAKIIATMVNEDIAAAQAAQMEEDKRYVTQSETDLRKEWGGDYEKNHTLANRAFNAIAEKARVNIEALTQLETAEGRFLLDHPDINRIFAIVGREMDEGSLGPALTETEADGLKEQIDTVRKQMAEAQQNGNSKKANELYQKEQALITKLSGNKPLVGASGRTI